MSMSSRLHSLIVLVTDSAARFRRGFELGRDGFADLAAQLGDDGPERVANDPRPTFVERAEVAIAGLNRLSRSALLRRLEEIDAELGVSLCMGVVDRLGELGVDFITGEGGGELGERLLAVADPTTGFDLLDDGDLACYTPLASKYLRAASADLERLGLGPHAFTAEASVRVLRLHLGTRLLLDVAETLSKCPGEQASIIARDVAELTDRQARLVCGASTHGSLYGDGRTLMDRLGDYPQPTPVSLAFEAAEADLDHQGVRSTPPLVRLQVALLLAIEARALLPQLDEQLTQLLAQIRRDRRAQLLAQIRRDRRAQLRREAH